MIKTAEAVSLGHPDKMADYISSYILDQLIAQDPSIGYAVEVMIKGHTVVLGGEISTSGIPKINDYVKESLREIGYDERYAQIWGDKAFNINQLNIIKLIGLQSREIRQGVSQNGWGDQGVFVGYACQGENLINHELFLAQKLNNALYEKALKSDHLGLDIKTQISLDDDNHILTAIVAVPMLQSEDLTDFVKETLNDTPNQIIINGTGTYQLHSSVADCGITGRKLACDFYSTAAPIGGGSPWTKDPTKADLTLNLYARYLAIQNLKDNDECFVYLSSCIGRSEFCSAVVKTLKNGITTTQSIGCHQTPSDLIKFLRLDTPVYTKLCRNGLMNFFKD